MSRHNIDRIRRLSDYGSKLNGNKFYRGSDLEYYHAQRCRKSCMWRSSRPARVLLSRQRRFKSARCVPSAAEAHHVRRRELMAWKPSRSAQRPVDAHSAAGHPARVSAGQETSVCGRERLRVAETVVLANCATVSGERCGSHSLEPVQGNGHLICASSPGGMKPSLKTSG